MSRRPRSWRARSRLRDGTGEARARADATTRASTRRLAAWGAGRGRWPGAGPGSGSTRSLLEHLTKGRRVALVSGTNGKTTTTQLLAVALGAGGDEVVSNETGSNMPPGHVAALAGPTGRRGPCSRPTRSTSAGAGPDRRRPRWCCSTCRVTSSTGATRSAWWRAAGGPPLAAAPHTQVVANADDPLVAWGAGAAPRRARGWVPGCAGALDAVGCPSCEGRIDFDEGRWALRASCGFTRPGPRPGSMRRAGRVDHAGCCGPTVAPRRSSLALPGRFNRANALMAVVAAAAYGIEPA